MLFMVIERFKHQDAVAVYRRFLEQGRMTPERLKYIKSWTAADFSCCFQVMESDDPQLFQEWMAHWEDLIDFEIVPVVSSEEAVAAIVPKL